MNLLTLYFIRAECVVELYDQFEVEDGVYVDGAYGFYYSFFSKCKLNYVNQTNTW